MRHSVTKILIGTLLCLLALQRGYAHKPYVTNYYRKTYNAANKNWDIAQDRDGVVYFGNDDGLLEFDGINWRLYPLPGGDLVRAITIAPTGEIFTGGYEEFGVWHRDLSGGLKYTSLSASLDKEVLRNDDVWRILAVGSEAYFQSFSKIYRYKDDQITTISPQWGGILFLLNVDNQMVIQRMKGSLLEIKEGQLTEIPGTEKLSNTDVMFILPFHGEDKLIGTSDRGLYVRNAKGELRSWDCEFSRTVGRYSLNRGIVRSNGNYVFGTILNGVYEVDPQGNVLNHFSTDNFLQNNTTLALMEDNCNNLWVASDRGISYIHYLDGMDCYTDPMGRTGAVYAAALYAGHLVLGTNQGVYRMSHDKLYTQNPMSWLRIVPGTEGQVWDLRQVGDKLLCGHNSGMKIIDRNFNVSHSPQPETGVYTIQTAMHRSEEYLLLGTYNSINALTSHFEPLGIENDIREPVKTVQVDEHGNIWVGHPRGGVYRYRFSTDGRNLIFIGNYSGTVEEPFYSMRLLRIGNRVVFYDGAKFYAYNDIEDKLVLFDKINDCFTGVVGLCKIIPLGNEHYLALGNKAAFRFSYDGQNASMIDKVDIGFGDLSLVNRFENAVSLDNSLSLICLDNGFLLLENKLFATRHDPFPMPVIRAVATRDASGKEVFLDLSTTGRAVITYKRNSIRFEFSARNALTGNVKFRYRLKGVSENWSEPERINEIEFSRLPEGDYTFYLRTEDNLGNLSDPVSFRFHINPVWYSNSFAYAIYFLLLLGAGLLSWSFVLRRYRNAHLLKVRMREEQRLRNMNIDLQKQIEDRDAELFRQTSSIIRRNELITQIKDEIDLQYRAYPDRKVLKPLYDKISGLLSDNMDTEEDWKNFLISFESHHKDFFRTMKALNSDLSPSDLKICACLRLNLSSKEIASLMNVSVRAVENSRYRLRKKLNIPPNRNINDFLMEI